MIPRTFIEQKKAGHEQLFRTLGIPAVYKNSAGTKTWISVIFRNKESETAESDMRLVSPGPVIRVRSSNIDDRDTDTATFTIDGTEYLPDSYQDDGDGLMKIFLRL